MKVTPIVLGGQEIYPGQTVRLNIPVAKLYTDDDMFMPITVIRGRKPGPRIFVSAAVHGDELNGIEIIRRLLRLKTLKISNGTLILVHIVNVYGVLNKSRYMPDRRDLNRSFPGSPKGSLAGRLADTFVTEVLSQCDYGIDLHTGAMHRSNLPQVRANLDDEETKALATAFGVPVMLNSDLRDNSLREAGANIGVKILLYEAGEALRFDEVSIRAGVRGVLNVLGHLGIVKRKPKSFLKVPYIANHSSWIRANSSGIVRDLKHLGDHVLEGEILAVLSSPFGEKLSSVTASRSGVIIGKQNIPLAHEGDALFHLAFFSSPDEVISEDIESFHDDLLPLT